MSIRLTTKCAIHGNSFKNHRSERLRSSLVGDRIFELSLIHVWGLMFYYFLRFSILLARKVNSFFQSSSASTLSWFVRIKVDPEPIPGTLGTLWDVGTPVHSRAPDTHSHTFTHSWGSFRVDNPPTSMFSRGWRKLEETDRDAGRTWETPLEE